MKAAKAINRSMGAREWTLLLILSVLWGGSFFFVEIAVRVLPPLIVVVLRVGLAAIALNLVVLAMGKRMPGDARIWLAFVAMGFINNLIPFTLIVWGQTHIASGLASILNATTPLFTIIVAHLFTSDEALSARRVAGIVAGMTGVAVMVGLDVLSGLGANVFAQLAILGASIAYACGAVFGRRFSRLGVAPLLTATGQVTASTVMLVPVALVVEQPWTLPIPGAGVWGAVLGLALLSTALAYILYFRILATAGATNLLLVTLLIPVSAVLLGTTILGETLAPAHFLGMGLIALGLAAIDGRLLDRLRGRRPPMLSSPANPTAMPREPETQNRQ